MTDASETLAKLRKFGESFKTTSELFDRDVVWHLDQLLKGVATIAPYRAGDRVELAETEMVSLGDGWYHCRHFLVTGAIATVSSIYLLEHGWRVHLLFDDESWIDREGVTHRTAVADRHVFAFPIRKIRKAQW